MQTDSPEPAAVSSSVASAQLHDRAAVRRSSPVSADSNPKRSMPVILPPAKVDAALAARAAKIKLAVAEARGEAPPHSFAPSDHEVEEHLDDDPDDDLDEGEADGAAPLAQRDLSDIDDLFHDDPDDPGEFAFSPHRDRDGPRGTSEPAHVEEAPAEQARVEQARVEQALPTRWARGPLAPASVAPDVEESSASIDPGNQQPDQVVAEAAASIIAAMRSLEGSHVRHLEAIELEAARRCELLTAQAELDAELIRLHARREAHTIVSAAHKQTDEVVTPVVADQLSDIGETFSRFAEAVERTIASGPAPADTVWD